MLTYERPTIVNLGSAARAHGQAACHSGNAAQGSCKYGYSADPACNPGTNPTLGACANGTSPNTSCSAGTSDD